MLLNPAKEQSLSITKDTEVEVSSRDEGFIGAWYRAILEESPTKSGRKKLRVRYTTLINDDYTTPLTEIVEQSFIRPIPPESDSDFEEGSVVDADLKDGWWNGVVIKKLENEKFLVYFDSPPDVIQFEKQQLRTHFDWIDSKWVKPQNKVLNKSSFSCGTMIEVNCEINKSETVWVPAIVVKEIEIEKEKKLIVKCCNKELSFNNAADETKPNITVDISNVRPIPPPVLIDEYKLLDRVEAFRGSGWCNGVVRGILSDKRYRVSFLAMKEESVFKNSDLRPLQDWEDGVWHQGQPKKKETSLNGKRKNSVALSEFTAMYQRKKLKKIRSSSPATKPMTTRSENVDVSPQVIPLAKESAPIVNDDVNATPVKETESSPAIKNQNGLRNDLTKEKISEKQSNGSKEGQKTNTNDDGYDDQPLASWIQSSTGFNISKLSSDETKANKDNTETTMTMPFSKHSPIWKDVESMEVFKSVPQKPHFNPLLLETREEFREGLAMGKMVSFSSLLEKVQTLKLNVTRNELKRLQDCFHELEKYGFDIKAPMSRVDMILSLQDKRASTMKERKEKEKKIIEEVSKKQKVEEELRDVENKILELRDQESDLKMKNEVSEKEIAEMKLCVSDLDKKIEHVEVEFQKILAAPW